MQPEPQRFQNERATLHVLRVSMVDSRKIFIPRLPSCSISIISQFVVVELPKFGESESRLKIKC